MTHTPNLCYPPDCAHRLKIVQVKAFSNPAAALALGSPGGRKNQPSSGLKIDCHSGLCYVPCSRPGGGSCPYYHVSTVPSPVLTRALVPKASGHVRLDKSRILYKTQSPPPPKPFTSPGSASSLFLLSSIYSMILRKVFFLSKRQESHTVTGFHFTEVKQAQIERFVLCHIPVWHVA